MRTPVDFMSLTGTLSLLQWGCCMSDAHCGKRTLCLTPCGVALHPAWLQGSTSRPCPWITAKSHEVRGGRAVAVPSRDAASDHVMHLQCAAQARWRSSATRDGDGAWSVVEPLAVVPHLMSGRTRLGWEQAQMQCRAGLTSGVRG